MRKNGSRLISIGQYRTTDLFVFALILAVAEILTVLSARWFPGGAFFTFSLMLPITLTVMMRWGWQSIFYAIGSGLITSALLSGRGINYACYIIGNACVALMLIPMYLIGKDKIRGKWWCAALFVLGGWLCVYLGRSAVWAIGYAISPSIGGSAIDGFAAFAAGDALSLVVAEIVVLVLRRLDGMFEDQKTYLKRLEAQRKEKMRIDQFGENLGEIDEETFEILNKDNDLF